MTCKVTRDEQGSLWIVPAFIPEDGKKYTQCTAVHVWWNRDAVNKGDELLMIRQENETDRADVICLTLGQAYELLHALGCAIMDN